MSNKVAVLIDGYNFYHAISNHMKFVSYPRNLKWLFDDEVKNVDGKILRNPWL